MLGSLSFVLLATAAAGATPCESLRTVSLPQTTIVTAATVEAGPFVPPGAAGRGAAPAGAPGAAPGGGSGGSRLRRAAAAPRPPSRSRGTAA